MDIFQTIQFVFVVLSINLIYAKDTSLKKAVMAKTLFITTK